MSLLYSYKLMSKSKILKTVKILITTLGEKGSVIETKTKEIRIRIAKPKTVVDPTGAGDGFRAGFLAGWQRGYNLATCGKIGAVAASFAIEKYGTQEHKYNIDEFKVRYKKNFNQDIRL